MIAPPPPLCMPRRFHDPVETLGLSVCVYVFIYFCPGWVDCKRGDGFSMQWDRGRGGFVGIERCVCFRFYDVYPVGVDLKLPSVGGIQ